MSDERTIRALVDDLRPVKKQPPLSRTLFLFLTEAALVVLVFTRVGMAVDGTPALLPVLLCSAMAFAGAAGALVSAIPGRRSWQVAAAVVGAGLLIWSGDLLLRAAISDSAEAWGETPWIKCLLFTLSVSVPPSYLLFRLVRGGWPVHPHATTALLFVSGASIAALTTTLECPSNAPLHVLLGHFLPLVLMAGFGSAAAPIIFQSARWRIRT